MKALVFSNVSPRELNGKFVKLVNDRGLSIERVVPCKRYGAANMDADVVIATIEGTLDSERKGLECQAQQWGKRVHWVALRAAHPGWEAIGKTVEEMSMGRQRLADASSNDWEHLAEKYAEENDALRARCTKLDESVTSLRERVKELEGAAAERRADRERAERLEADLQKANADAALARKRLADAVEARSKAEARLAEMSSAGRPSNGTAQAALFSLLDAGVLSDSEVLAKLRSMAR